MCYFLVLFISFKILDVDFKFCLQFFRGGCIEQPHMYHRSWDRSWTQKRLKNLVSISWTRVLSAFGQASTQRLRVL